MPVCFYGRIHEIVIEYILSFCTLLTYGYKILVKEILFNVISDIFEKEEVANPYSSDSFEVTAAKSHGT